MRSKPTRTCSSSRWSRPGSRSIRSTRARWPAIGNATARPAASPIPATPQCWRTSCAPTGIMHRPLPAVSEQGRAVKALARQHQEAIWALHQTVSRLRSVLLEFYPQALQAFPNLKHKAALTVLAAAPTPAAGQQLTRRRVVTLLQRCGRRNDPPWSSRSSPTCRHRRLRQPARVEAGARPHRGRAPRDHRRDAATPSTTSKPSWPREFDQHPQAAILRSAPGLGPILAARVLAEIGDDPTRFDRPEQSARVRRHRAGDRSRPAARTTSRPAKSATSASPTPATGGRSRRSPNPPAPATTTTNAVPPATSTTPRCATSPTNSSAASGGAWPTTSPGTTTPPGHTEPNTKSSRCLTTHSRGMSTCRPGAGFGLRRLRHRRVLPDGAGLAMAVHRKTDLVLDAPSRLDVRHRGEAREDPRGGPPLRPRRSQGGFKRSSQHLDDGGVRWGGTRGLRGRARRWRVVGGSGRRIGRCGRRCAHRAGRSRRVRCSGRSGV